MPAHPHADLMLQYAQDALETDTPWDRWEVAVSAEHRLWASLQVNPLWDLSSSYRRKPRTIRIGDHEVPEPERNALKQEQCYYVPTIERIVCCTDYAWDNDSTDERLLARGLVHLTAEAARAHARALIALTAQPRE